MDKESLCQEIQDLRQRVKEYKQENDRLRKAASCHLQMLDMAWFALKTDLEAGLESDNI